MINLYWDDTMDHVVHYDFGAGWTWKDFYETAQQEHAWGETLQGKRYDIIGNLSHATFPKGTPFSNILRLFDQGPQNRRMIVVVGSPLARAMIQVGERIYPRANGRFHYANTVEDARHLIQRLRAEPPAESAYTSLT